MDGDRGSCGRWLGSALFLGLMAASCAVRADSVRMKNELVYKGTVHKDDTLVAITDPLKRVLVRDNKIARIDPDGARAGEAFEIEQPNEPMRLGGSLPNYVLFPTAEEWDDFGQRPITYRTLKNQALKVTQAIVEIDPAFVKLRGTNAPWSSVLGLDLVPRPIILGLLARVDQEDENERRRVCQFLIQAHWYAEASRELDRLAKDFPNSADVAARARQDLAVLAVTRKLDEIGRLFRARQPRAGLAALRAFPIDGASPDQLAEVRNRLRDEEAKLAAVEKLADRLREDVNGLDDALRKPWDEPLTEILAAVEEAPEIALARLEPFARILESPDADAQARIATAFSAWFAGPERASKSIAVATALLAARDGIAGYLAGRSPEERGSNLTRLNALAVPVEAGETGRLDPELATRIVRHLPPPRADRRDARAGEPRLVRILDDTNPTPTEYAVLLPPEYHPLRSYPTLLVLHRGRGPLDEVKLGAWGAEAARSGYIVIAPEYMTPGANPDYRYSAAEHAAAVLALYDARKRFAIDPDRVFAAGALLGGNMAIDFGLSHPDMIAGVIALNGVPAKFISANRSHNKIVPVYNVVGELAPAATDMIAQFAKDQIVKNYDYTHVEYTRRGLEDLPEALPAAFDWANRQKRVAQPKAFDCVTTREGCDDRFFGVVVHEILPDRVKQPDAVDALGRNLPRPASIKMSASTGANGANLMKLTTDGLKRFDIWVGPDLLDFSRRLEVRVNTKTAFKGLATPGLEPMLEDVRIRGDREQIYWMKVVVGR